MRKAIAIFTKSKIQFLCIKSIEMQNGMIYYNKSEFRTNDCSAKYINRKGVSV